MDGIRRANLKGRERSVNATHAPLEVQVGADLDTHLLLKRRVMYNVVLDRVREELVEGIGLDGNLSGCRGSGRWLKAMEH
jgi:hypothetical protein